jgi:adenylate kinase family enzyme
MKSVVVYGPQGCGKTQHADRLQKHFGLHSVHEDFESLQRSSIQATGTLYISNTDPLESEEGLRIVQSHGLRVWSFRDAMRDAGVAH